MKIKQLEWEDCAPTISSSVVSRARGMGIEYWIYGEDGNLCLSEVVLASTKSRSMGSAHSVASVEKGKNLAQELFEARIKEVVEETHLKAAEIRWYPQEDGHIYSACGKYRIHSCSDGDTYVAQSFEKTLIDDAQTKMMWRSLILLDNYAPKTFGRQEDAANACQAHKQAEFESTLMRFL